MSHYNLRNLSHLIWKDSYFFFDRSLINKNQFSLGSNQFSFTINQFSISSNQFSLSINQFSLNNINLLNVIQLSLSSNQFSLSSNQFSLNNINCPVLSQQYHLFAQCHPAITQQQSTTASFSFPNFSWNSHSTAADLMVMPVSLAAAFLFAIYLRVLASVRGPYARLSRRTRHCLALLFQSLALLLVFALSRQLNRARNTWQLTLF